MPQARLVLSPRSELRGRYLVQNRFWRIWLTVVDALLRAIRSRPTTRPRQTPRSVLVCVGGHLGDAVVASAALSQLHQLAPNADLGVICASSSHKVLESLPYVQRFHTVDHWRLSRKPVSLFRRWFEYVTSHVRVVREIRAASYDAAVDLYAYYPNSATILAMARVPVRIGYGTGGFGPLYTHEVPWTEGLAVHEDHRALMNALLPESAGRIEARYSLGPWSKSDVERAATLLGAFGVKRKRYALLHVGAGVPERDWPIENWITVARELLRRDLSVLLSGAGPVDAAKLAVIERAVPGAINLCDRLPWPIFRPVVAEAAVVLCVNTVSMHLAAAEGTPCVAVLSGIDAPNRWHSGTSDMRQLTHPVPCAPCHRSRGCADMTCIRAVTPDAMLEAATPHLSSASA